MCSVMAFVNEYTAPLVWLAITIILVIFEAATVELVSIWFAIGALCAAVAAGFGAGLLLQIAIFAAVSVAALLLTRRFVQGMLHVQKTPTNADSAVGQEGIVTEDVDNIDQTGRARIAGLDWTARSADGNRIPAGTTVKVVRLDGVKAMVQPTDKA